MNVSDVARQAGIAPSAVRWYEAHGVVPPARRGANGYRRYVARDVERLRLVAALRGIGLAPEAAGRLAGLFLEHGIVDGDLVPVLAEQRAAIGRQRMALDRLEGELLDLESTVTAAAKAGGRPVSPDALRAIRVLFVCTGNSARSQIAEALLERFGGSDFEVDSAGTEPRGVNPFAIAVLAEDAIDWSQARSKSITEFLDRRYDYVITVCDRAKETCPVFPGSENTMHWGLDDPADVEGTDDQKLEAFRRTSRELTLRLRPFVTIARRAAGRSNTPSSVG